MDLKEAGILGEDQHRHWYFASKSRALLQAVGTTPATQILDIGAGSGYFSKVLLQHTAATGAICVDPGYAADRTETVVGKPLVFKRALSPTEQPPAGLVLLMDVLEHVDDDRGLVKEVSAKMRSGTRFVVSVPAFSWLWSGHDVFLEHRRRYTLNGLMRVLTDAGLVPRHGFYFFASVFPAAVVQRLSNRQLSEPSSRLRRHHPLVNGILTRLCTAESLVARHNRLFGLTAFAVAEKP